jgi:hypothetical protein
MAKPSEEEIKKRAHQLWEQNGPHTRARAAELRLLACTSEEPVANCTWHRRHVVTSVSWEPTTVTSYRLWLGASHVRA